MKGALVIHLTQGNANLMGTVRLEFMFSCWFGFPISTVHVHYIFLYITYFGHYLIFSVAATEKLELGLKATNPFPSSQPNHQPPDVQSESFVMKPWAGSLFISCGS